MIERGDLILSYESSWTSWIVRKITRSRWSHVSMALNNSFMISAVPLKGVWVSPLITERCVIYRLTGVDAVRRGAMASFCTDRIGNPYDFVQILLLGWRILTDTLKTAEGDPFTGRYVCSELIAEAAASVGVYFGNVVDNVLPETIAASELTTQVG